MDRVLVCRRNPARLQMSDSKPYGCPAIISGHMYVGVPTVAAP